MTSADDERRAMGGQGERLFPRIAEALPRPAIVSRTSLYVALGAGVYWGTTLRGLLNLGAGWPSDPSGLGWMTGTLAGFIVAVLALALAPVCMRRRGQKAFALVALALSAFDFLLSLPSLMPDLGISIPTMLTGVVDGGAGAVLMLFWGLNLASLDRKTAERTVLLAASLAGVVLFGICLMPARVALTVSGILRIGTPCLFLLGGYDLPVAHRVFRPQSRTRLVCFYISRALFGLLVGVSYFVAINSATADGVRHLGWGCAVLCLVASVGLLVWCAYRSGAGTALVSVMPVCMAAALFFSMGALVPSAGLGGILTASTTAVLWFTWIILSSVQVSEFKEEFGMDEVTLSFSEKGVVTLFWLVGELISSLVAINVGAVGFAAAGAGTVSVAASQVCAVALVVWFVACIYSFTRLAGAKERGRVLDEYSMTAQERTTLACRALAADKALSVRERDTLELLVLGHTRAFIADALGISPGTVQTHLSHVYQKLDVHKREEVLRLVGEYQAKVDETARYAG